MMVHEKSWKDLPTHLYFVEIVSDKSFVKLYEDNVLGSLRDRDNTSNICLDGSRAHCLCHYLL